MTTVLFIATSLIALVLLILIVVFALLWLGNSKIVVFPGVGIAVSTALLLGILAGLELVLLISARVLWKYIS